MKIKKALTPLKSVQKAVKKLARRVNYLANDYKSNSLSNCPSLDEITEIIISELRREIKEK